MSVFFAYIISQLLSPSDAGIFFILTTVVLVSSSLFRLGTDKYLLKNLSFENYGTFELLEINRVLFSLLIGFFAISVVFLFFVYQYEESIEALVFNGSTPNILALASVAIPFFLGCLVLSNVFQARNMPGTYILALNFFQQSFTCLSILFFYFSSNGSITLDTVVTSYIFGCFISFALLLGVHLKQTYVNSDLKSYFSYNTLKTAVIASSPLLVVIIFTIISKWCTQFMISAMDSSENVAVYSVSLRLVMLISFVLVAINAVTAPKFAIYFKNNDLKNIKKMFNFTLVVSSIFSLLAFLFFIIFGEWLLQLFGEEYRSGYSTLIIMSVGQLVNVLCGSVFYILQMKGEFKVVMNINIVFGIVALLLSYFLINSYSLTGAAYAYSISMSLLNICGFVYMYFHIFRKGS